MAEAKRALVVSFGALPACSGKARRLGAALDALGPRLTVDALTAKVEGEPHIERYAGARLLRVPMSGDLAARAQTFERALRRQLSGEEYDLVLLGDAFGALPVLQRRTQQPFRLIVDGSELESQLWPLAYPELELQPRFRHRLLRLERHALAVADLVLSGSDAQTQLFGTLGLSQERVRRIPLSVALGLFPEAPPPPQDPFVLAAVGRGATWEGLEIALRAVAVVRDRGGLVRLSVAGPLPPTQRQRLRELAESLEVGDSLELRGELSESRVGEFLAAAHASLCLVRMPKGSEALPLGGQRLIEGLAAGRPVIAADVAMFRELAGPDAIYLAGNDPVELAEVLIGLARDPPHAQALGHRGRERARERFDPSMARAAWLTTAEALLDPSGVGLPESSSATSVPREGDSATLSVEPTARGLPPEREDTNRLHEREETTHVGAAPLGEGADWFRAHLPPEESLKGSSE